MFEMPKLRFADPSEKTIPIWLVTAAALKAPEAAQKLPAEAATFAAACLFDAKPGRHFFFVQADGAPGVVFCLDDDPAADPFQPGALATQLPPGVYRWINAPEKADLAALSFLLGGAKFTRYKSPREGARLVAPENIDAGAVESMASCVALARTLIDTPANDLGPDELEAAIVGVAGLFGAETHVFRGEELARGFPLIQSVGKGSPRAPRLVDLRWRPERTRKMTLIGKGVCFDSGGLDIKPESAMGLMKKDMGGAASSLAAAAMIMAADVDVSLRLLVPIVENSVSGEAFRPGDVYPSRKGLSVEIGNTDAEGRLILADALALADEEKPELLIDFATLTGAARVALGPDLPPFFTDDEALAADIARHGAEANDPVWRLPLWNAYELKLEGKIADLNNAPPGGMAGSIMAALFLRRFVSKGAAWAHFDIYGWTPSSKPGRPEGGEAQAARLVFSLAREKFGTAQFSGGGTGKLNFDKRLTPARRDLAAEYLRELIAAETYAPGRRMQVRVSHVNVQRKPSDDAPTDTQALHGETLIAYEERAGWCWVQLDRDRYVGYVCAEALTENITNATHRVSARHTMIYSAPDIKSPPLDALPFGAEVHIVAADAQFSQTSAGSIFSRHLAPNTLPLGEFVGLAEMFLHTPYLWGGKTDMGIDCSGLVQVALAAAGVAAPRDTDMMEAALGSPVDVDENLRGLRRGDLVFWRGHVGIMQNEDMLLHANAHFMMVTSEPLIVARDRIRANASSEITSVRRV